jgi:internalin A
MPVGPLTNAGLMELSRLNNLQFLSLESTPVTDAGLMYLSGLNNLFRLDLSGTQVTDEGISYLRTALPKLEVIRKTLADR